MKKLLEKINVGLDSEFHSQAFIQRIQQEVQNLVLIRKEKQKRLKAKIDKNKKRNKIKKEIKSIKKNLKKILIEIYTKEERTAEDIKNISDRTISLIQTARQ